MQIQVAQLDGIELERVRLRLLSDGMPVRDLIRPEVHFFTATTETGAQIGWGGLEVHGGDALLRAVLVNPVLRGIGAGRALVDALLEEAARLKVTSVWLLTSEAEGFFSALGFAPTHKSLAPPAIRNSEEFAWHADSHAVCMRRAVA
ncbi:MAG: GNAT family N-acetyltransferase [Hyphomonadaceae bacterium]|nr:GNAT family N-acetyltransferase [Hyphomonadaceae bacterium]